MVFDMHGNHRLNKVRVFPADMDSVSHFEFAISNFNGAHAQTGKVRNVLLFLCWPRVALLAISTMGEALTKAPISQG